MREIIQLNKIIKLVRLSDFRSFVKAATVDKCCVVERMLLLYFQSGLYPGFFVGGGGGGGREAKVDPGGPSENQAIYSRVHSV